MHLVGTTAACIRGVTDGLPSPTTRMAPSALLSSSFLEGKNPQHTQYCESDGSQHQPSETHTAQGSFEDDIP